MANIVCNKSATYPNISCCFVSGKVKPVDLEFICDTISDLNDMLRNGLHFKGKTINVQLQNIVCDAPARALIKGTKAYSGYYACDRRSQKGNWIKKLPTKKTH